MAHWSVCPGCLHWGQRGPGMSLRRARDVEDRRGSDWRRGGEGEREEEGKRGEEVFLPLVLCVERDAKIVLAYHAFCADFRPWPSFTTTRLFEDARFPAEGWRRLPHHGGGFCIPESVRLGDKARLRTWRSRIRHRSGTASNRTMSVGSYSVKADSTRDLSRRRSHLLR